MTACAKSPWSDPDNDARLRRWIAEGLSAGQVAAKFATVGVDLSRNAVIGRCHRTGIAIARGKAAAQSVRPARTATPVKPHRPKPQPKAAAPLPAPRVAAKVEAPKVAAPVDVPVVAPRALPPAQGSPVPLFLAAFGQCRYPVGGSGADLLVCGAPTLRGRSYCADHHGSTHAPARRPLLPARDASRGYSRRSDAQRDLVDEIGGAA